MTMVNVVTISVWRDMKTRRVRIALIGERVLNDFIHRGVMKSAINFSACDITMPNQSPSISPRRYNALILITALIAYSSALQGGFIWDDATNITENPLLRNLEGLYYIWFDPGAFRQYYPLTLTGFWAQFQLWETHPFGYHLVNVLVHGFSAVLLFRLLRFLGVAGALLAALLFAAHPANSEAVAWATEFNSVLSGFFYLAGMYLGMRFFGLGETDEENRGSYGSWLQYAGVLALYCCAALSKTSVITFPAALLLLIWWRKGRLSIKDIALSAPFFAVSMVLAVITVHLEEALGTRGVEWAHTPVERFLIAGRVWWFYLGKIVWPFDIVFFYPRWSVNVSSPVQWIYPLAVLGVVAALWGWRKKIGRGPLTAVLFYSGTIFPFLGFFNAYYQRYAYVAQHWQYMASIGLIVLFAALLEKGCARVKEAGAGLFRVASLLIVGVCAFLTWADGFSYKDYETHLVVGLEQSPNAFLPMTNLAAFYRDRGNLETAMKLLKRSLELNPHSAETLIGLGQTFGMQGRHEEAVRHFQEAVKKRPEYPIGYNNLAVSLFELGRLEEARDALEKALELEPDYLDARRNLEFLKTRLSPQQTQ